MESKPDYVKWLLVAAVVFLIFRPSPDHSPGPKPVPIDRTAIEAGQRFGCDLLEGYSVNFSTIADRLDAGELASDSELLAATNAGAKQTIIDAAVAAGEMIRSRLPAGKMDETQQRQVAATMRGLALGLDKAKDCRSANANQPR